MVVKTFGTIRYELQEENSLLCPQWVIDELEPHVSIRLKSIFPVIPRYKTVPFVFPDNTFNCGELEWFMMRYPLRISKEDSERLSAGARKRLEELSQAEAILLPDYVPPDIAGLAWKQDQPRPYQLKAAELLMLTKRMLLADDVGLGKTLTGMLPLLSKGTLPAAIVVQSHLPRQWAREIIKWTGLRPHIIKKSSAYTLPSADVYIFKYTSLTGWVNFFGNGFFKYVVFDEIQELRTGPWTNKYACSKKLADEADYVLGLSATPIYNYGGEIYHIMNVIKDKCLGNTLSEFGTQWGGELIVKNTKALGTHLKENLLLLRRTAHEVERELPPVNTLVYTVDADEELMDQEAALAEQLALKVLTGTFMERGDASRQLDMLMRRMTGVGKAASVAAFVRMLLESRDEGEDKVVLVGWHRDVYEIWMEQLKDFSPVMYTGSESAKQKDDAVQAFIRGDSRIFILSLRSGIGLDGLQHCCHTVVFGELDWSPEVHAQVTGRLNRDGQKHNVTSIYLVSDSGSDPVITDVLGIKADQSFSLLNPLVDSAPEQHSDEGRIKKMAEDYLKKQKKSAGYAK